MKIYAGNLANDVTEDDLREAFTEFGKVTEVTVVKDRFNGVSKGFGFVEMPVQGEATKAISNLHRKELKGRSIEVNEARPRPQQSSGRGGFGGGKRRY